MTSNPDHRHVLGSEEPTTRHVRRAVQGDADSITWVVDRFAPVLLAQARYRLGGLPRRLVDPEDLVQDVWARTLPHLPHLPPRDGRYTPVLMKFLSTALLNRSNTLYKKYLMGKPRDDEGASRQESLPAETTGVVSKVVRSESCGRLLNQLGELSSQDQEIIVLRGIEQNRNQTVARLLGLRPNTVAVRYRRALERLRKHLPGTVFDELTD